MHFPITDGLPPGFELSVGRGPRRLMGLLSGRARAYVNLRGRRYMDAIADAFNVAGIDYHWEAEGYVIDSEYEARMVHVGPTEYANLRIYGKVADLFLCRDGTVTVVTDDPMLATSVLEILTQNSPDARMLLSA